jgi:acyl carrier protein
MSSRKERVRGFITSMFFTDAATALGDDDSLLQLQIVDSTGFLELVGFLESEFGIRIGDEDMLPENLDTLGCIDQFLASKLGPEGGG